MASRPTEATHSFMPIVGGGEVIDWGDMYEKEEEETEEHYETRCPLCGRPCDYADLAECSVCGVEGCDWCLTEWGDVYPYLCPECLAKLLARTVEEG